MYRTNITTAARRAVGAGIIASAAALAACSDSMTAPQAPAIPDGANAVTLQGGFPPPLAAYVTFRVADTTGATLKETGWTFIRTTNPTDSIAVPDNGPGDLDPAVGYIKAKVPKAASYKACFDWSLKYAGDFWGSTYRACGPEVASTAQTVAVGVTHGKRKPQVVMLAKDDFGALVGGATYTIYTPEWATANTATEGGPYDRSPVSGNFTYDYFYKPHPDLTVCEVSPPPKHQLTSTKCFTIALKFGGVHTLVFNHERLIY
jgi:hypothetical protein